MTLKSFVKATESYEPMNHTRFVVWVTIWVVHLPERSETEGLCGPCVAAAAVVVVVSYSAYGSQNKLR